MVIEQNIRMPGVNFQPGIDVTAETLNGLQQYLSKELAERSRDLVKFPGFAWGLKIGRIDGQTVTITQGVGFDQYGSRLYQDRDVAYRLLFSASNTSTTGYLCVRGVPTPTLYKVHPYNGTRKTIEQVISLSFTIDNDVYADGLGHYYGSGNSGLVIAQLKNVGASYSSDEAWRSPVLTMQNGL